MADDLTSDVHNFNITGIVQDRELGPLLANGTSRYRYLGCYQDGVNGRLLPQQFENGAINENSLCQTQCLAGGFAFAGTGVFPPPHWQIQMMVADGRAEFQQECWCGNTVPSGQFFRDPSLDKCTFACNGDSTQACGGDGTFISVYYDTLM